MRIVVTYPDGDGELFVRANESYDRHSIQFQMDVAMRKDEKPEDALVRIAHDIVSWDHRRKVGQIRREPS